MIHTPSALREHSTVCLKFPCVVFKMFRQLHLGTETAAPLTQISSQSVKRKFEAFIRDFHALFPLRFDFLSAPPLPDARLTHSSCVNISKLSTLKLMLVGAAGPSSHSALHLSHTECCHLAIRFPRTRCSTYHRAWHAALLPSLTHSLTHALTGGKGPVSQTPLTLMYRYHLSITRHGGTAAL